MKKIPTLFKRTFDEHHSKHITPGIAPGFEWVLEGRGIATEPMRHRRLQGITVMLWMMLWNRGFLCFKKGTVFRPERANSDSWRFSGNSATMFQTAT